MTKQKERQNINRNAQGTGCFAVAAAWRTYSVVTCRSSGAAIKLVEEVLSAQVIANAVCVGGCAAFAKGNATLAAAQAKKEENPEQQLINADGFLNAMRAFPNPSRQRPQK